MSSTLCNHDFRLVHCPNCAPTFTHIWLACESVKQMERIKTKKQIVNDTRTSAKLVGNRILFYINCGSTHSYVYTQLSHKYSKISKL